MAVITPTTDVYLLKVPLEINDINQLTFSNATAQHNYFNSLPKLEAHDFTYQRKDGTIRFEGEFDELLGYNYVMYRNDAFSNKWFYAYITNMEWKSPNCTDISIKTDVWQTYQFDISYKPTLIEREHTNNDAIGSNTLPENLELGEFVTNGNTSDFGLGNNEELMVVADVSMIENYGTNQTLQATWSSGSTPASYANGIPSGCFHVVIGTGSLILPNVQRFVAIYDKAGLADAIQQIYVLPSNIVNDSAIQTGLTISTTGSAPYDTMSGLGIVSSMIKDVTHMVIGAGIQRPTTVDGYTPRNNKVLCYPFNYFNVSNNAGSIIPYHYEDFTLSSNNYVTFEVEGVFCPSGSIKAIPRNYKRQSYSSSDNAYDFSINGAKYPICSWNSDSYTNWLTQNAVNMQTELKTTLIGGALSTATNAFHGGASGGGGIGAGIGLIAGLAQTGGALIGLARDQMLAKTTANFIPDQSNGNLNSGDINFAKRGSQFTFIPMSVKAEYAKCADDYFSMFGYATNRIKRPNITGRRNWNYVKTIGCYISGNIPQDDMQEIKNMFDRGITLWHNPATFADYSQNNDII